MRELQYGIHYWDEDDAGVPGIPDIAILFKYVREDMHDNEKITRSVYTCKREHFLILLDKWNKERKNWKYYSVGDLGG